MTSTCTRCGRDCSDGDCWTDDEGQIVRCIACLTPDQRASIAAHYRDVAREEASLAAQAHPGTSPEGQAQHLLDEAERIERTEEP